MQRIRKGDDVVVIAGRDKGKRGSVLRVIPRKARQIMRRGVITIEPDASLSKAASMMGKKKIGALPVVEDDQLVGIITATDVLLSYPEERATESD